MFIRKSKHDAAIAAKDAEIAGLMKRARFLNTAWGEATNDTVKAYLLAADRAKEIRRLEAKLARYTAPRERGKGGRFLPLNREQVQA